MSLDICILDDKGYPIHTVSFGVESHHKLMSLARNLSLSFFLRLEDYYADVNFQSNEIDQLLIEIREISNNCSEQNILEDLLLLKELVIIAKKEKVVLYALAD